MYLVVDNAEIGKPITRDELLAVLKYYAREKSPDPDGWGMYIFHNFLDLMLPNLLAVAEKTQVKGFISGASNASFIALISKQHDPNTFVDYRPISLCISFLKIIAKLTAYKNKPVLSNLITLEQFGFLEGRRI